MRLRAQRKAIYAAMGLTVLALVGGFTLASLSLGGSSNAAQQGSHTTTVSQVTGLSWNTTTLVELGSAVSNTTGCASLAGCDVSTSNATVCGGSAGVGAWCQRGDFAEEVILNTTANHPFVGLLNLTVYVTAGGTIYTGATFHFTDSGANNRQFITMAFDVGSSVSGPAVVTSVTVIATA